MWGLIVAVVYAIIMLISGQAFPQIFSSSTDFLLWWYVITSIILAVFMAIIFLGMLGIGSVAGASIGGFWGAGAGFLVGGALAVWATIVFLFSCILSIGGAYLLHGSMMINPAGVVSWDSTKLIVGPVLIVLNMIISQASSSSFKKRIKEGGS